MKNVTIPNSVTSFGNFAFRLCSELERVTIGEGVETIGSNAFYECFLLQNITIPSSVTSIGDYSFYRCSGLDTVTIKERVETIGDYAFYECSSLQNITIPSSATSIKSDAFSSYYKLTNSHYWGKCRNNWGQCIFIMFFIDKHHNS